MSRFAPYDSLLFTGRIEGGSSVALPADGSRPAGTGDSSSRRASVPGTWTSSSGQERLRENLEILVKASRLRGEPLDHILLTGPAGLGKTTLALLLAREMETEIRCTSGPALERAGDLAGILTSLPKGGILFVDEIHRLHRVIEEYLYPAMEDFRIDIVLDRGPGARTVRLHLERFTLIGATTRARLAHIAAAGPIRLSRDGSTTTRRRRSSG